MRIIALGIDSFLDNGQKKLGNLINARAETVFEKPTFRQAIKSKRCLIPMSGFYEWHQEDGVKQPYFFKKES